VAKQPVTVHASIVRPLRYTPVSAPALPVTIPAIYLSYSEMASLGSGQFSLQMLGGPSLTDSAGQAVAGLGPGKPLVLLAYLAVRGDARRDELIELLWGGVPEANARNAFRQALHRLRGGFGEGMVTADRERVSLSGRDRLQSDRDEFLSLVDLGRPEEAVALYKGDFLEGVEFGESGFDEWAESERTRLRGRFTWALGAATQAALESGRWVEAAGYAQRLTAAAPYDEAAAISEASVLVSAGRRQEATATLQRFVQRLSSDLGLAAPAGVAAMLARLARPESGQAKSPKDSPSVSRKPVFAGREQQLAALVGAVRELGEERGTSILLDGDVGIGKSRLIEEFIGRARALGRMLVLQGRERIGGAAVPYAGIAEALRGTLRAPGLGGASQHLLAEAARILPELRDSFELPAAGPIEDDAAKLRFFEGVAALLEAVAYEQPVCLVLEDVHHGSASTADLISYLVARLQSSPVLLLMSVRLDALPASHAARLGVDDGSGARVNVDRMHLDALDDAHIREIVSSAVPANTSLADIDRVVGLASGNPLRALDAARRASAGQLETALPVPIHDLLAARLEAAPPSRRRVFFAAALLQRAVSLRLLAAASHLSESATLDAAVALEADGLFAQRDGGYALAHDTTAHLVVELSGAAGRALFAGWAADALADEPGAHSAELAYLYGLAGRQPLAFANARLAAFAALACGAASEAARLFGLALTFAPNAAARQEVESSMAVGGAQRRRLGGGDRVPDPDQETLFADLQTPVASDSHATPPAPAAAAARGARRSLGQRRIRPSFMIAGVATLVIAVVLLVRNQSLPFRLATSGDSLLVVQQGHEHDSLAEIARTRRTTPSLGGTTRRGFGPAWTESLALPWINASVAPDGQHVTVERMTRSGTDLYLFDADERDSTVIASSGGDNIALGWAPDGSALLVSRPRSLADGSYDTDLFEYRLDSLTAPIPIDTSAESAVTEAAWSPDGSRLAWSARIGSTHQQDIFISRADGSGARNVTHNPAEDDHARWSPDGTLLAFTSDRDGNTELYAYDLSELRLWRLTFSPAQDDHAVFSPDSRRVAFESTRDGDAAVYVMPALGGDVRRVTPAGQQYSVVAWRGRMPGYLDRMRILGPSTASVDDTVSLGLAMLDASGHARAFSGVQWSLLDSAHIATLLSSLGDGSEFSRRLVAEADGSVRVVARIPGWRSDTLTVLVGRAAMPSLADGFTGGSIDASRWVSLGDPQPRVGDVPGGGRGLFPNGDLQWESGVLARDPVLLQPGLSAQARINAPFNERAMQPATLEFSLIVPPDLAGMDRTAPRLTPVISVIWDGESGRVTFAVNGESFSLGPDALGSGGKASHLFAYTIDGAGHVVFALDGVRRWQSTTRVSVDGSSRVQLWIAGRGTDGRVAVGDVRLGRAP